MPRAIAINHVTLIVDDLERAATFYERELGLEPRPSFAFDFPAVFFRINDTQQLHLSEWDDARSFRGHACLVVEDWEAAFVRFRELGIIDVQPWGRVRRLPDGSLQMFVRDPAGNLLELSAPPGTAVDPALLADPELCDEASGLYRSHRDAPAARPSAKASLYRPDEGGAGGPSA